MRMTTDIQAGMTYIYLAEPQRVHKTQEHGPINLDMNKDGQIIGIEIYGQIDDIQISPKQKERDDDTDDEILRIISGEN